MRGIFLIFFVALAALPACQRPPGEGDSTRLAIRVPTKQEFMALGKVDALSTIEFNLLCFAVNVTGPGIPSASKSCDLDRGITSGSVPPGGVLEVTVPGGDGRSVELIGFLRSSTSEPCPGFGSKWNWPLTKTYSIAKKSGITLVPPEAQVELSVTLPPASQHIVAQNGWPVSCESAGWPAAPFSRAGRIQTSSVNLQGGQYRFYGRISETETAKKLQGTQFRLKGKVRGH